jgi:hypothetical protein
MLNIILNFFRGILVAPVQTVIVAFGTAFGPSGAVLLSTRPSSEIESFFTLHPNLSRTHVDWISLLSWVRREYTIWIPVDDAVFPQVKLLGNAKTQKPIPEPDEWWVGQGFITATVEILNMNIHGRLGFRPDDVDGYWAISFTIKIV